jgi:hypothetical protein
MDRNWSVRLFVPKPGFIASQSIAWEKAHPNQYLGARKWRELMKNLLFLMLLTSLALGEDQATALRIAAGCGPDDAQFDVKTDKQHHPVGQPEPGKALVYLFSDTELDNFPGIQIGGVVTRVGADGTWVGADNLKSYFFFSVDPGNHRLCTSQQSKLESTRINTSAALSFTAEAGRVYYFRTRTPERRLRHEEVELRTVDPAQAQLLIGTSAFSTSRKK